jgi:hypothetical protein
LNTKLLTGTPPLHRNVELYNYLEKKMAQCTNNQLFAYQRLKANLIKYHPSKILISNITTPLLRKFKSFLEGIHKPNNIDNAHFDGTILILLISCTGMLALSLYESERRTKEIGIRKINGASSKNILVLLSKEFIKWVVIAFIFASPIAYFIMQKWLQSFVYNTEIS